MKIKFDSDAQDYGQWFHDIPDRIQARIKEYIPSVRRDTKKVVKSELRPNHGLDKGVYRSSFIINNFAESKWHIGFQVFARKPHYRLTHLLENGHRIKLFRRGRGERTKWGNIGMNFVKTKNHPSGTTPIIKHIEIGQDFAEEALPFLYRESYSLLLEERTKKKK